MIVDEGGTSKGDLSAYVSGELSKRAQSNENPLDIFKDKTALLREYLLQLADPLDKMLTHFNVRELLEEACKLYLAKAQEEGGDVLLYPNRLSEHGLSEAIREGVIFYPYGHMPKFEFAEYEICETRPLIYQQVVSDPQPSESFQVDNGAVDLDTLSAPDNFRRLIPRLKGYGFALQTAWRSIIYRTASNLYEEPGYFSFNTWPGGGGSAQLSPSRLRMMVHGGNIHVRIIKSLCVEADAVESAHDLVYTHQLQRDDLRFEDPSPGSLIDPIPRQDKRGLLCAPQRIHSTDPIETLCKILGDDIVKEFDGKYKETIRMFSTM